MNTLTARGKFAGPLLALAWKLGTWEASEGTLSKLSEKAWIAQYSVFYAT